MRTKTMILMQLVCYYSINILFTLEGMVSILGKHLLYKAGHTTGACIVTV
jgi:hypothetical protein